MNELQPYSHKPQNILMQFCKNGTENKSLHIYQITAIEAASNYCIIHYLPIDTPITKQQDALQMKVCKGLNELDNTLEIYGFARVSRSLLINIEHLDITDYVNHTLKLYNGEAYLFSKGYTAALKRWFVKIERAKK